MSEVLPSMEELLDRAYQQGREELIKQFDESIYMIIHVREYGEHMPCCYSLKDVAEQLMQDNIK